MVTERDLRELRRRLIDQGRRLGLRREDAEDAAQKTIVRLWAARDRIEGDVTNYALRAMQRTVLDHQRWARRRKEALESDLPADVAYHAEVATANDGGLGAVVSGLLPEWLASPLSKIRRGYREAIVAIDVKGMTQREYATASGLTPATVRSRLYRGRSALRAILMP